MADEPLPPSICEEKIEEELKRLRNIEKLLLVLATAFCSPESIEALGLE